MQTAHAAQQHSSAPPKAGAILRRQCACGTHMPGGAACGKCGGEGRTSVPPVVNQVLGQEGRPLDGGTRDFMEHGFGADFSGVRVHTDARAAQSARAVHAKAYTVGRDIVFKDGHYQPHSRDGRMLLAHELAHVAQQRAGAKSDSQPAHEIGEPGSAAEHQADDAARIVMQGGRVPRITPANTSIQRVNEETHPPPAPPSGPGQANAGAVPAAGSMGPKPPCGDFELFTKLAMPLFVPNSYFRDSAPLKEKDWDSQKDSAAKGKCVANGTFPDINLSWDLGNPNLGTFFGKNVNKNDLTFDVEVAAIQDSKLCCRCLGGTVSWSFNLEVTNDGQTGRTQSPLTGTKTSNACKGDRCCTIAKTLPIGLGFKKGDFSATIDGTVKLEAVTFGDNPKPGALGKAHEDKPSGLSTGAKVGIGLGIAAGVGGLIAGGFAIGKALHH